MPIFFRFVNANITIEGFNLLLGGLARADVHPLGALLPLEPKIVGSVVLEDEEKVLSVLLMVALDD